MKRIFLIPTFLVSLLLIAGCTKDSTLTGEGAVLTKTPESYPGDPDAYPSKGFRDFTKPGDPIPEREWAAGSTYPGKVEYLVSACRPVKHEKESMYGLEEVTLETLLYDGDGNPILAADGSHLRLEIFRKRK